MSNINDNNNNNNNNNNNPNPNPFLVNQYDPTYLQFLAAQNRINNNQNNLFFNSQSSHSSENSGVNSFFAAPNPHFSGNEQRSYENEPVTRLSQDENNIGDRNEFVEESNVIRQTNDGGVVNSKHPWSDAEDQALISSYMRVSTDGSIGTGQRARKFWSRVKNLFEEARIANPVVIKGRNVGMLTNRWSRISAGVQKWVGYYEVARRRATSGTNERDILSEARVFAGKFATFERQWYFLSQYPRWETVIGDQQTPQQPEEARVDTTASDGSGKRSRAHEEECSQTGNEGPSSRPPGIKAQKRKKGKSRVVDEDEDIVIKEIHEITSIMKQKLLATEQNQKWERKMKLYQHLCQMNNLSAAEEERKNQLFLELNADV